MYYGYILFIASANEMNKFIYLINKANIWKWSYLLIDI